MKQNPNKKRIDNADKTIAFYETLAGVETQADGASLEQVLTDLLADMRHTVTQECFENAIRISRTHFNEEK